MTPSLSLRCACCDKTNNEEIQNNIGDYTDDPFVPDPDNPDFDICLTCFESIRDSLFEFEEEDEDEAFDYDD